MRRLLTAAIASALAVVVVPTGGHAETATMDYYDWIDLETGTVTPEDPFLPTAPPDADFQFAYNSGRTPHAVIFQNQSEGVQIAYSTEPYADVTLDDVGALAFSTSLVDVPFSQVAVLLTADGNYFKAALISEAPSAVSFSYEQLLSAPPPPPAPTPEALIADLQAAIEAAGLHHGTANALNASLRAALASLEAGDTEAAAGQLQAFLNKVSAQRGKKVSEELADTLTEIATAALDGVEPDEIDAAAAKRLSRPQASWGELKRSAR